MTVAWTVRRYRDGDERAIVELLNTAYGRWGSLELWRWKYTKNPAGIPIIWLAECNSDIVGHFAIIPIMMKVGNAIVKGSFADDAATHPYYQGKGVFSYVVNRAYQDAAENDIPITYGFANTDLGATYARYDRKGHICFMTYMTKVLNWEPFLARYIRSKFLSHAAASALRRTRRSRSPRDRLRIEMINRFDQRANALWELASQSYKIIARRDDKYLNWRYAGRPEREYVMYAAMKHDRILGYCVLTQRQRRPLSLGYIVDVLGCQSQGDVVGSLIDSAVRYFEEQNVDGVVSMVSERHPYAPLFRRAGFIPQISHRNRALHVSVNLRGSPIDPKQVYSQALLLSQSRLLKEKTNWFMMEADSLSLR